MLTIEVVKTSIHWVTKGFVYFEKRDSRHSITHPQKCIGCNIRSTWFMSNIKVILPSSNHQQRILFFFYFSMGMLVKHE